MDGRDLARRNRLRTADLLALLPGLPHLLACYELLGLLASSRPGRPNLLAWERPWRRRDPRGETSGSISVSLPAYADVGWDEDRGAFLLLPDLGTFPVRLYRPSVRRLLTLRRHLGADLPPLVVATTGAERATLWRELLDDVARDGRESPLRARVATWETAAADLAEPWREPGPEGHTFSWAAVRPPLRKRKASSPGRRLPQQIQADLAPPPTAGGVAGLGSAAARLSPEDHCLLDLIGHHPFLPLRSVAEVLGWTPSHARIRFRRLVGFGLARPVEANEVDAGNDGVELAELTRDGLRLVAARLGLPLAHAVRENGLVGGGPTEPLGGRHQLVTNLQHTLGTDAIFVAMISAARRRAGGLVEWRNAAACARGRLRPDGYGLYRQEGQHHGFFVEYDRGTMGERALLTKLAAYYDYLDSGRYRRDFIGFPVILVVAASNAAEERIARIARYAATGHGRRLPMLLTCEWQICRDPTNPDGLFGSVWREEHVRCDTRRLWPLKNVG